MTQGSSDPQDRSENRVVEFDRLNTVGKAVFLAGGAFRTLGSLLDFTVSTIGDVWIQAEKAFTEEISEQPTSKTHADTSDMSVDARIIEETELTRSEKKRRSS